jgi:hypothetical protein
MEREILVFIKIIYFLLLTEVAKKLLGAFA